MSERVYVLNQPARFDMAFCLDGDEDGGVGIKCRECDRGGAPIAYLTHPDDRTWQGTDVEVVHTITALLGAGQGHLVHVHPE